jgi:protein-arginine deiminase (PAD)
VGDYELHADYDRDGRLTARAGEYALRNREPGAIVVPNLDADRRRLPARVAGGPRQRTLPGQDPPKPLPPLPVTRDRDQPVRLAIDDELLPVIVRTIKASAPPDSRFFLRVVGRAKIHVELFDERGLILKRAKGVPDEIPFAPAPAGKDLKLRLEVQAPAGTPAGRAAGAQSLLDTHATSETEDEAAFSIEIRSRDSGGKEILHDSGLFTIAPMIVVDNAAPAFRFYISDMWDSWPSQVEVTEALDGTPVAVIGVPYEASGGDDWLQDHMQHAVVQGADGYRQVLIHLPRTRNSNIVSGSDDVNLERFVSSHFASRDLGVFDDLWKRSFAFKDKGGRPQRISFRGSRILVNSMKRVPKIRLALAGLLVRIDPTRTIPLPDSWMAARRVLRDHLREAESGLSKQPKGPRRVTAQEIAAIESQIESVEQHLPLVPDGVSLPLDPTPTTVTGETADKLFTRLGQAHGAFNYGGNIEASPPVPQAKLGKLVIGNHVFPDADLMDPDLSRLFTQQNKQPVVRLNTGWLDVGHVDEVIGFAPAAARPGFAVLHASPTLALKLLELARARYVSGLPADHPQAKPEIDARWEPTRLTVDGTHPVTRLFRGKLWVHRHQARSDSGVPEVSEPPRIHQAIARLGFDEVRYRPGPGPLRWYLADATVREILFCEISSDRVPISTNTFIEATFLTSILEQMTKAFDGIRMLALPVLFDRVDIVTGWDQDARNVRTSAYTPSVVNFQPVNGRLLVPRPYGPRMLPDDARAVLGEAFESQGLPSRVIRRLTSAFIRQRNLTTGAYWIAPQDLRETAPGTTRPAVRLLENGDDLAEQFRDSFPGVSRDEIKKRIVSANRANFDAQGLMKEEPSKYVIADNMLDLFETYVELIAAELDVPLFWVDAWHYHIHLGGIHCGTNVLRVPRRGSLPDVWTVTGVNKLERL